MSSVGRDSPPGVCDLFDVSKWKKLENKVEALEFKIDCLEDSRNMMSRHLIKVEKTANDSRDMTETLREANNNIVESLRKVLIRVGVLEKGPREPLLQGQKSSSDNSSVKRSSSAKRVSRK